MDTCPACAQNAVLIAELWEQLNAKDAEIATLIAERDAAVREAKINKLKANQLHDFCPDHRDKQQGKPCLACAVEEKSAEIAAARHAEREACAEIAVISGALTPFSQSALDTQRNVTANAIAKRIRARRP